MLPPCTPRSREQRIATCLRPLQDGKRDDEQEKHDRKESPALSGVAHHHAKGIGETGWNEQDQQDLNEVGKGRRVLEGM